MYHYSAAYNLLQDLGDAANIHEWFRMFCELHEPAGGGGGSGGRGGGKGGKGSKGAARGAAGAGAAVFNKGKGPAAAGGGDDDDDEEDGDGGGGGGRKGGGEKGEKGTFHLDRQR